MDRCKLQDTKGYKRPPTSDLTKVQPVSEQQGKSLLP